MEIDMKSLGKMIKCTAKEKLSIVTACKIQYITLMEYKLRQKIKKLGEP